MLRRISPVVVETLSNTSNYATIPVSHTIFEEIFMKRVLKIVKKCAPYLLYGVVTLFIYSSLTSNLSDVASFSFRKPWLLVLAVAMYGIQYVFNAYVWGKIMHFAGERISLLNSLVVYISSYIVRYIPGNVWAIGARAAMNKEHGVKIASSIWGWIVENVSFLFIGLCFSILVLFSLTGISSTVLSVVWIAFPLSGLIILRYELLERFVRIIVRKKFPQVVQSEVGEFSISMIDRLKILSFFVISWILYSVQFILIASAMIPVAGQDFILLAGVNALAWSVGYISVITPSGAGIREGIIIIALNGLDIMSPVEAVVLAVTARITIVIAEILVFSLMRGTKFVLTRTWKDQVQTAR